MTGPVDWTLALAACGVGVVVGLTGMGGGALMTPMLVLFFNVPPLAAVSSDLVAAAVMKPVGSFVHLRRGTVNLELVKWLCVGSVPSRLLRRADRPRPRQGRTTSRTSSRCALGVALLVAAIGPDRPRLPAAARAGPQPRRPGAPPAAGPPGRRRPPVADRHRRRGRRAVVVGMTSVGSGSLIIIALMALYPGLRASELVGTDLVQAVPLLWSAAFGHILFGDFQLAITVSLLVGSIPGVYVGAPVAPGCRAA